MQEIKPKETILKTSWIEYKNLGSKQGLTCEQFCGKMYIFNSALLPLGGSKYPEIDFAINNWLVYFKRVEK